jgi:hypothetical protein
MTRGYHEAKQKERLMTPFILQEWNQPAAHFTVIVPQTIFQNQRISGHIHPVQSRLKELVEGAAASLVFPPPKIDGKAELMPHEQG